MSAWRRAAAPRCLLAFYISYSTRRSSWPSSNPTTYTATFFLLLLVPVTSLLPHSLTHSLSLCSSTQLSYHFVCLSYAAPRRVTFRSQLPPRKCISIGRGNAGCNGTPLSFFPFVRPTFQNNFSRRLGFLGFLEFLTLLFLSSKVASATIFYEIKINYQKRELVIIQWEKRKMTNWILFGGEVDERRDVIHASRDRSSLP